ncbi:MAG: TetR/AcrR family transcriptional regulator [Caulobacterales bacterium]|jgi:AcrR family transcriptional regulator|nr:TetR/AcrR family transcriptional regulator [Caulobacterales bacterium]
MNQLSCFVQSCNEAEGGDSAVSSTKPVADATPKTARGRRTRQNILDAAEKEFGERGFHEAAINRITESAGVAMGTFYVHFESKESIFRALVSHMGQLTRRWIAERVADAPDRLTAERLGLEAFIEFVRQHRDLYRIVNESQFVAPDAYHEYYSEFAKSYQRRLREAAAKGEISQGDDEQRAWSLIGISVFLGMRYGVWDDSRPASEVAKGAADFIEFGLKPEAR